MNLKGKNNRRQFEIYDSVHDQTLSCDSIEEKDYINWLCEAHDLGIIRDFQYQPESFSLFKNVKYDDVNGKKRTLFQDHIYSCDFMVMFDGSRHPDLAKEFKTSKNALSAEISAYIDTKGLFNRNGRSFATDRKWVWQKFKIYICEVIPQKFFKLFGCPRKSFNSEKTKRPRKMFLGMKTIAEMFGLK